MDRRITFKNKNGLLIGNKGKEVNAPGTKVYEKNLLLRKKKFLSMK